MENFLEFHSLGICLDWLNSLFIFLKLFCAQNFIKQFILYAIPADIFGSQALYFLFSLLSNSLYPQADIHTTTCILKKHDTHFVQVIHALRHEGLESSNLILGIDFTKSNEWTGESFFMLKNCYKAYLSQIASSYLLLTAGRQSFRRKSLHSITSIRPNPYEQAISIIGHTLSPFDEDGLIPCFGFGDGQHWFYLFLNPLYKCQ